MLKINTLDMLKIKSLDMLKINTVDMLKIDTLDMLLLATDRGHLGSVIPICSSRTTMGHEAMASQLPPTEGSEGV